MTSVKKAIRFVLFFILSLVVFLGLYLLYARVLPHIKANSSFTETENGIEIFVKSNGVHTDIVVPVKTEHLNWNEVFPCSDFVNVDERYEYLAIGWGDKGFYLNTPEWKDLKFSTAFNAAFGLGETAMHITYRYKMPKISQSCRRIVVSKEQYLCLIAQIMASVELENNKPMMIQHPGYTQQDRFYEAKGRYSMFTTCNVWTGNTLKASGIKVGIWTPLESGLVDHLE